MDEVALKINHKYFQYYIVSFRAERDAIFGVIGVKNEGDFIPM
jgi:hypothetical protein